MMKTVGVGAFVGFLCLVNLGFGFQTARDCKSASEFGSEFQDVVDDVIFSPRFNPRLGCANETFKWPNATLVFNITKDFSETEISIIRKGMKMISADTCIKFREKLEQDKYLDVVEITKNPTGGPSGCAAHAGRKGGTQPLFLAGPGCIYPGVVAHELMHSLGILHEHQRPDRDSYITINWINIPENAKFAFKKYDPSFVSTFDLPYDFLSIMHYAKNAFAIDSSKPTITCKKIPNASDPDFDPDADSDYECELGQYDGLTELDKEKLRRMYKCTPNSAHPKFLL